MRRIMGVFAGRICNLVENAGPPAQFRLTPSEILSLLLRAFPGTFYYGAYSFFTD